MHPTMKDLEDARRYRALRDSGRFTAGRFGGWGLHCNGVPDSPESLDAAADKLIAEAEEQRRADEANNFIAPAN